MDGPWVKGSSNYLGIRHGWSESVAPPVAVPLVADPVWPGVSRSSLTEVGLGAHRVGSDPWGVPACALGPRDAPRAARVRPSRSELSGTGDIPRRPMDGLATLSPEAVVTWLILPVVICLSQRLSHACLSISNCTAKLRMAH